MTAQADPYVRVYYRIIDDPRFESVYDDDRLLATWLRLLLTADATYPAPAPIPANVNRRAFGQLVQVGLIEATTAHRYRVHGLTAEREKRSDAARAAANARHGKGNPPDDASPPAPAMRPHSGGTPPASNGADVTKMHSEPLLSEPIRATPLLAGISEMTTTDEEAKAALDARWGKGKRPH